MNKKYLSGALLIIILAGGIYIFKRQDYQDWIRATDQPLLQRLDSAARAYFRGDFDTAAIEYQQAIEMAKTNDVAANEKWRDLPINRHRETPNSRLFSGKESALNQSALNRGGIYHFKTRVSESAYGLALTMFGKLQTRFNLADLNAPPPPAAEIEPILSVIATGLEYAPQSESLRLLKAEILAACRRYQQAISALDETLVIDARSAEAYNQLGLIYSSPAYLVDAENWDANHRKALEMFEKSTECTALDGGRLPDPFYNLGMYYAMPLDENSSLTPDDARQARHYFEQYLRVAETHDLQDTPQYAEVSARLAKLPKK